MTAARKFTFDREFRGGDDVVPTFVRASQKKTLTQAELDQLCADARAEGLRSGEVQALEVIAASAESSAQAIRDSFAQAVRLMDTVQAESAQLALAMARKLARTALAALPSAEVEAVLRDAMHQAHGEPRMILRAAPRVADAISARLSQIATEEAFDGRVQIIPDESLAAADCRIEWRGGGAERAEAAIESGIAQLIARRFHPTDAEEEQADDRH